MRERLEMIGLVRDNSFGISITQLELADCVGLTPVHTNRVLQELRHKQLISMTRNELRVLNRVELERVGQFNNAYLHQQPSRWL